MASLFGHGLLAYAGSGFTSSKKLVLLAIVSAIIPDVDVISFAFGIPYQSVWGHRGFTHSIFFAVIWALLLTIVFGRKKALLFFIVLFLSTLSHPILDAMTTGGKGVAFFAPFENSRYFFSFRPIKVSPIGILNFFSNWGLQVIKSEIIWIGIPSAILIIIRKIIR